MNAESGPRMALASMPLFMSADCVSQDGRISIANSDSEGRAYLDAAIDAGRRAVAEQTA